MKKYLLKGQLKKNPVSGDRPEEQILQMLSNGACTLDDVLQVMYAADTGLRPETLAHVVQLFMRTLQQMLLEGKTLNLGLFHAFVQARGTVQGGVWDRERNSLIAQFTQGEELRCVLQQEVDVEIIGPRPSGMYISSVQDTATQLTDHTATAGRALRLRGRRIALAGPAETTGITLHTSNGTRFRLPEEFIALNQPSELIIQMPESLPEGPCTLTVTSCYNNGGKLLRTPRSTSTEITITAPGSRPAQGDAPVPY